MPTRKPAPSKPTRAKTKSGPVIESDESLRELPLREFCDTNEAADILQIRYRSFMTALPDSRIRKVKMSGKCWLVLRSSLNDYLATRHPGSPGTRRLPKST